MSHELMPKKSGMNRIVNAETPEDEQLLINEYEKLLHQKRNLSFELEKGPELKELITQTLLEIAVFLKEYDVDAVPLTPDEVIMPDYDKMTPEQRAEAERVSEKSNGRWLSSMQKLFVYVNPKTCSKLKLMSVIVHEVIHINAFQSMQIHTNTDHNNKGHAELLPRRSGFQIESHRNKKSYFHYTNEAITSELTKRFILEHFPQISGLQEELREQKKIFDAIPDDEIKQLEKKDGYQMLFATKNKDGKIALTTESYPLERHALNDFINKLYELNKDKFKTREDIWKMVVETYFHGNILPIARLVEKTFGKGSFREIGEDSSLPFNDIKK